jgi:hypothetical protein
MDIRTAIDLVEKMAADESNFEKWIAGSELVNADGSPIKLYHGTSKDQDFKSFKMPKNGIWFTTDPKSASDYSLDNDSQGYKEGPDGKMYKAHTASRVIPVYARASKVMHWTDWPDEIKYANNYKRAQGILFDRLRWQGYDAINFNNGVIVIIGSPNQIKSSIGNNGNYDPAKKNIHESLVDTFRNIRGHTCEVYKNPTLRELKTTYGKDMSEAPRAFLVGDDILVWQATTALHQEIRTHFNLLKDAIPLLLYGTPKQELDAQITDNSENTPIWHSPEIHWDVMLHPYLEKMFKDIDVSYYDEDIYGDWTDLGEDEDEDEDDDEELVEKSEDHDLGSRS